MLDRLPFELLRLVLEHLAPLNYTPKQYEDRRSDLKSCSLVGRAFQHLAAPMLAEVLRVAVPGPWQGVEVPAALSPAARGKLVKLLVFTGHSQELSARVEEYVQAVAQLCPLAVEVRVLEMQVFKLDWLAGMIRLKHLVLYGWGLEVHPPSTAAFSSLIELSIRAGPLAPAFFDCFLSPSTTPHLRALGFRHAKCIASVHSALPLPALPTELLEQLDVLSLDVDDPPGALLSSMAQAPSLLLSCHAVHEGTASIWQNARHLAVCFYGQGDRIDFDNGPWNLVWATLALLHSSLPNCPFLELLILPHFLHPFDILDDARRADVWRLLDAAGEREIKVVFEDEGVWEVDSLISRVFWRRRLAEKARMRTRNE
ncbi:hypothetical protein JCM8097_000934 [Rhodosporidiobolus ruineniae]